MYRPARFTRLALAATLIAAFAAVPVTAQEEKKEGGPPPKLLGRVEGFADWVTSVDWSADGQWVAAGSYGEVRLIDADKRKSVAKLPVQGLAQAVAFSPDGKTLAVGGFRTVVLFDVATKKPARTLEGHRGQVRSIAYSPDGQTLATGAEDMTLRLWDARSGEPRRTIEDFEYPVMGVAFSPDGDWIATATGDETRVTQPGKVRLWDVATGAEREVELPPHEKAASSVAFSPNGRWLLSTGEDEKVNVYDVPAGKALGFFAGHGRPTNDAAFAVYSETVVSVAGGRAKGGNFVMLWNRADGEEITRVEAHEGRITSLALSPDKKKLVTGSYDQTIAFWDLEPALPKIDETLLAAVAEEPWHLAGKKELRAGIIGLDTSHATAFTGLLNRDEPAHPLFEGVRVVAAYPKGSPDIESSTSRVPGYTKAVKEKGVEIVDSIEALLPKVDVVFLETNDGRPHLEQILPVLKAGKPVFVDKPIAASLTDAVAIFEAARRYEVPVFSASSLRWSEGAQKVRGGSIGKVKYAETFSPASLEKTHPDLYWYGIHGVELLFTAMGPGCESVRRIESTRTRDVVAGNWEGGRSGQFEGYRVPRQGKPYGGTATGENGETADLGPYKGYQPLLVDIIRFFRTGEPPVGEQETLEIYAFMTAADVSKENDGAPVLLESVLEKARTEAKAKLKELGVPEE